MSSPAPILFLDIDDVLCLNRPYGGFDVIDALDGRHAQADAVYREVFDRGSVAVASTEARYRVVLRRAGGGVTTPHIDSCAAGVFPCGVLAIFVTVILAVAGSHPCWQ